MPLFIFSARTLGVALLCAHPLQAIAQSLSGFTLAQALQQALASNPRLTSADRDMGAAEGRRIQAGARPNPQLYFEADNALAVSRQTETTLQLSQLVELGGKRDARVAAALAGYDDARWQRAAVRLAVLSDTASALVAVLGAERRVQLLDRQIAALDKLTPLLQRRLDAGASSPADIARVQVANDLTRVDRERAKADLANDRWVLASAIGIGSPSFTPIAGGLERTFAPMPFQSVLAAIDSNPQLMRWTAVQAQRSAEILAARAKAVPDVTVGIGWRHYAETQDNGVRLGITVPIPVLDQNRGGIREAQEIAARAESEKAVNRIALITTLGRAYETVQGALRELDALRRSALPNARKALEGTESGYEQGRYSLIELLDSYRALYEAQRRELDALIAFHAGVVTIEGLTGSAFTLAGGSAR